MLRGEEGSRKRDIMKMNVSVLMIERCECFEERACSTLGGRNSERKISTKVKIVLLFRCWVRQRHTR